MRIAVVDDEKIWRDEISRICQLYYDEIHDIDMYASGEEFYINRRPYDMVFLDVELGEENGIDLVEKIGQKSDLSVCFVSSHLEYSRKGYRVNAFRYIDKACLEEEIKEAIEAKLKKQENYILQSVVKVGNFIITKDEITYIEVMNRQVIIHTMNKQCKVRQALDEIGKLLEEPYFFRSHKSCIVNLYKIVDVKDDEIFMVNGEKAFCSIRKRKELVSKWIDIRIG